MVRAIAKQPLGIEGFWVHALHPALLALPVPFLVAASLIVEDLILILSVIISATTLGILAMTGTIARRRVHLRQRL